MSSTPPAFAPGSAGPVLSARGVGLSYGGRAIFKGAEFDLQKGERWVLLGASGSGKSSLLRLFTRLEEPSAGRLEFMGRPLSEYDPRELRRRVALCTQTPVMFPGSVRDNLSLVPRGIDTPTEQAMVLELSALGLSASWLDQDASRLSGGERQRVGLARSLLTRPDVLLLDEPTSALDPHHEVKVAELLCSLCAERRLSMLVVTHSERLTRLLGGRLALLEGGKLLVEPSAGQLDGFFRGDET